MKEDFSKNEGVKTNKPLQEITEQELQNSIENMAKVAPDHEKRFKVLEMQKEHSDQIKENEKLKVEKDYWFLMGQNKGMHRDTSLQEQNAKFEANQGLLRAKTKAKIKEFYDENYSLSKTFKTEAKEKPKVKIASLEKEAPDKNKAVKETKPTPEISEQELQNSINIMAKVAPDNKLRFKVLEFQKAHLIHKEAREKLQGAKESWRAIAKGKETPSNESLTKSRANFENNQALLRTKTKEMVKNFYDENYSLSKTFNGENFGKPKPKDIEVEKE